MKSSIMFNGLLKRKLPFSRCSVNFIVYAAMLNQMHSVRRLEWPPRFGEQSGCIKGIAV